MYLKLTNCLVLFKLLEMNLENKEGSPVPDSSVFISKIQDSLCEGEWADPQLCNGKREEQQNSPRVKPESTLGDNWQVNSFQLQFLFSIKKQTENSCRGSGREGGREQNSTAPLCLELYAGNSTSTLPSEFPQLFLPDNCASPRMLFFCS